MAPRCGIYAIRQNGTDRVYVGQAVDLLRRRKDHFTRLRAGRHHASHLQRAFTKYGEGSFSFVILSDGWDPEDKDILTCAEQEFMDSMNSCFNTSPSAASNFGFKHAPRSEEMRRRMSEAQKARFLDPEQRKLMGRLRLGMPSPWKGRSPSEETRAKMRAAKAGQPSSFKGKKHTTEAIARMSEARKGMTSPNKGKPRSEDAKRKQSASMIGKRKGVKVGPMSEVTKARVSASKKGKPWSEARRAAQISSKNPRV